MKKVSIAIRMFLALILVMAIIIIIGGLFRAVLHIILLLELFVVLCFEFFTSLITYEFKKEEYLRHFREYDRYASDVDRNRYDII